MRLITIIMLKKFKRIKIGDDCIFGENVCLYDHNHKFRKKELIRKQGYNSNQIIIRKNCWIGSDVTILAGVEIGDNVVIAANSIITKNIDSNEIVYNKTNFIERNMDLYG